MAKEDQHQHEDGELEPLSSVRSHSRSGSPSPDINIVVFPPKDDSPSSSRQLSISVPRRQSAFAQTRADGSQRTPNRVRFDVEDSVHSASVHEEEEEEEEDESSWLEDDYMVGREQNNRYGGREHTSRYGGSRRDGVGQRAPLLTDIEAPSVTVAESAFNPEDLLESARPKSGMSSAFMNMANSIMYVYASNTCPVSKRLMVE